jgi:hypothetical protein
MIVVVSNFIITYLCFERKHLTVCVTRKWAGVDSAWEQKKTEARKMLVNRAESHLSGARFVGRRHGIPTVLPENECQTCLI